MSPCPPVIEIGGPLATTRGPGKVAVVDRPAQIDCEEGLRTNVAHAGESRHQRFVRIHHTVEAAVKWRLFHIPDGIVVIGTCFKMRVAIDQAGKDPVLREIHHRGSRRNRNIGGRSNLADPLAFYDEHDVVPQFVAGRIEQMSGLDIYDYRARIRLWCNLTQDSRDSRSDKDENRNNTESLLDREQTDLLRVGNCSGNYRECSWLAPAMATRLFSCCVLRGGVPAAVFCRSGIPRDSIQITARTTVAENRTDACAACAASRNPDTLVNANLIDSRKG